MTLLEEIIGKYEIMMFIFTRILGLILIAPIFSRKNIPIYTKIILTFFISLILANSISYTSIEYNQFEFIIALISELIIGFTLGFISYLYFVAFLLAGELIDMQVGFSMVKLFDIQNNSQVSILGNFYYTIALLFFLMIDGHHILIKGLYQSFKLIPIGHLLISENLIVNILFVMKEIFIIGFKVSSPILATIFLVNVFLGILSRTVPQMNVFVVGMPLKIVVGLLTIIFILPLYITALHNIFGNMYEEIFKFIDVLAKG